VGWRKKFGIEVLNELGFARNEYAVLKLCRFGRLTGNDMDESREDDELDDGSVRLQARCKCSRLVAGCDEVNRELDDDGEELDS